MDRNDRPETSLQDVYRAVIRHKRQACTFFLCVMAVVVVVTIFMPRTYRSQGKLLVRLGRENVRLDPTITLQQEPVVVVPQSREKEINSAIEILNSRTLADAVVHVISTAVILGEEQWAGGRRQEAEGSPLTPSPGHLATLSPHHLVTLPPPTVQHDKAVRRLMNNLGAEPVKESNVISVSYKGQSPELTQAVLETYIDLFLDKHIQLNRTDGVHQFFAEQAAASLEELTRRQAELRDLKNQTGPTSLDGQRQILVGRLGRLEDQLYETNAARAATETKIRRLREKLDASPKFEVTTETSGFNDEGTDNMRQQFYALQVKEKEAVAKYTDTHPKMQQIRQQIAAARKILDQQSHTRHQVTKGPGRTFEQTQLALLSEEPLFSGLQAKAAALRGQLAEVRAELEMLNENDLQVSKVHREVEQCEANYRKYAANLEESRIEQALQAQRMSNVKVLQPATYEIKPIGPRVAVNLLLGLVVGLLGGLGVAMVAEYRRQPSQLIRDTQTKLGMPILASIPQLEPEHLTRNGRNAV